METGGVAPFIQPSQPTSHPVLSSSRTHVAPNHPPARPTGGARRGAPPPAAARRLPGGLRGCHRRPRGLQGRLHHEDVRAHRTRTPRGASARGLASLEPVLLGVERPASYGAGRPLLMMTACDAWIKHELGTSPVTTRVPCFPKSSQEALKNIQAIAELDPNDVVVQKHVGKAEFELRKAKRPDYYGLLVCFVAAWDASAPRSARGGPPRSVVLRCLVVGCAGGVQFVQRTSSASCRVLRAQGCGKTATAGEIKAAYRVRNPAAEIASTRALAPPCGVILHLVAPLALPAPPPPPDDRRRGPSSGTPTGTPTRRPRQGRRRRPASRRVEANKGRTHSPGC